MTSWYYFCLFFTQDGDTALTLAASGGHTDVMELVKAGANFDLQNNV